VRVDSGGQVLTTNQGVPVGDNQNSLKAGLRGPALLEDFILREKITHFDHERIPERIVHARGSGAHGYFECTKPLDAITAASVFAEKGKRTPVFARFSTVVGERGSADTVRDVRGFAVKFYTDEGNWDLVGNNIPVFFIQDAMKFPDLIHAARAAGAHRRRCAKSHFGRLRRLLCDAPARRPALRLGIGAERNRRHQENPRRRDGKGASPAWGPTATPCELGRVSRGAAGDRVLARPRGSPARPPALPSCR
jgi:hypothetical protein